MVKVNAPAMSLDASGSLAGAITFSKWKGRNYIRQLVRPSNPRSAGQIGIRRMMKFLSQNWADLSTAKQDTWDDRASNLVVSPFNAYVGYNLGYWRNFLPPTQQDPADRSGTVGVLSGETATAGVRQITIDFDLDTQNQNQGLLIFRDLTTAFNTAWNNLVQVVACEDVDSYAWVDSPLVADEYFYNFRAFTTSGLIGAELGEVDATVT